MSDTIRDVHEDLYIGLDHSLRAFRNLIGWIETNELERLLDESELKLLSTITEAIKEFENGQSEQDDEVHATSGN